MRLIRRESVGQSNTYTCRYQFVRVLNGIGGSFGFVHLNYLKGQALVSQRKRKYSFDAAIHLRMQTLIRNHSITSKLAHTYGLIALCGNYARCKLKIGSYFHLIYELNVGFNRLNHINTISANTILNVHKMAKHMNLFFH